MSPRLKIYSAFGEPTVSSGELASTFTHQFSTKPYCATTGFSEYQMRKYRPVIGRWMSRDPMAEKGSVNVFLACRNNFFIFYDALGYCPLTIIVGSLPNDATPDAGGWFSANPPEITINGKSCPKDQHGWILDRTACSATIWLLQDTPFARDHEMSHYSCLQQYKSQLDSLLIDVPCSCDECPDLQKDYLVAEANYYHSQFLVCIAYRDCKDNGGGVMNSPWCMNLFAMQIRAQNNNINLQNRRNAFYNKCGGK